MTSINFDFEEWNPEQDILPDRPGGAVGFTVIQSAMDVGHRQSFREEEGDPLIGRAMQQAIELLAGSIEWLRFHGLTAAQVESKVTAYLVNDRATKSQTVRAQLAVRQAEELISDPRNKNSRLDPEKIIG